MAMKTIWTVLTALGLVACDTGAKAEEMVEVRMQLVRSDGSPLAHVPVRVVLSTEKNPRSPDAGMRLITDAQGRIERKTMGKVEKRSVELDNMFARHRMDYIDVGIEMNWPGDRALHWIGLDSNRSGTLVSSSVYKLGRLGRFDRLVTAWTLAPGERAPEGFDARVATMDHVERAQERRWVVELVLATYDEPARAK